LYKHNVVDSDCHEEITASIIYKHWGVINMEYYDSLSGFIDTG